MFFVLAFLFYCCVYWSRLVVGQQLALYFCNANCYPTHNLDLRTYSEPLPFVLYCLLLMHVLLLCLLLLNFFLLLCLLVEVGRGITIGFVFLQRQLLSHAQPWPSHLFRTPSVPLSPIRNPNLTPHILFDCVCCCYSVFIVVTFFTLCLSLFDVYCV